MSRMLLVIALVAVAAGAQDPTLKVGDDAPPLKIAKWVKGDALTLEKGKTYVVEFWATWCGPCVAGMPHLSELQEAYKDKVTFVGVTTQDVRGNTLEAVEAMVKEKGPGMGYTVAWDDAGATHDAWMTAARQGGIPCAFVVDANRKIAFIGHPIMLDPVLAGLADGTWDPVAGPEKIAAAFKRLQEIFQMDRAMALAALPAFEKENPLLAEAFATEKFTLLLAAGKTDEASAVARKLVEKGVKYNSPEALNRIAWMIVDPATEVSNRDLDLALKAATAAVDLTKGEDGAILDTLARVHYWKGDLAKAIEIQTTAVEKAANQPGMLPDLKNTLDQYKAEAEAKKQQGS